MGHGFSYDVAIIGAGPAGEKAATRAAYLGRSVALVEREVLSGGHDRGRAHAGRRAGSGPGQRVSRLAPLAPASPSSPAACAANVVRFLFPLTIQEPVFAEALAILERAIAGD